MTRLLRKSAIGREIPDSTKSSRFGETLVGARPAGEFAIPDYGLIDNPAPIIVELARLAGSYGRIYMISWLILPLVLLWSGPSD
jgi:hypothetical protein